MTEGKSLIKLKQVPSPPNTTRTPGHHLFVGCWNSFWINGGVSLEKNLLEKRLTRVSHRNDTLLSPFPRPPALWLRHSLRTFLPAHFRLQDCGGSNRQGDFYITFLLLHPLLSLPKNQLTIWPFAWYFWTQQGETKFQRLCLPCTFQHQKVPHVLYFIITLYLFVLKSCWLVTLSEVLSTPNPQPPVGANDSLFYWKIKVTCIFSTWTVLCLSEELTSL